MIPALGLRQYLLIGGGIALALLAAWAWRIDSLRGHYKEQVDQEKAAHAQTVANYTNTQAAAQADFDAKIKAMQLRNERLNDEADNRAADLAANYHDRIMRLPKAAACPASRAGLPKADLPEGDHGSGDSAGLSDTVIIPRSGAAQCAKNTGRLQAAREWALEMEKN